MTQLSTFKDIYCICKKNHINTTTTIDKKNLNPNNSIISNKLRQARIISASLGGKPVILN